TPIDPTRYHRLSVTFRLDGPFDLSFDPGGGAHGRVIWTHQPYVFTDSNELVAYPNEPTHVLDLADPAAQEEASQPAWTAAPVIQLRFDPNEDPGPRRWHVDEVRLAADDETSAGGFDVTFLDRALDVPAPDGTTTTFEILARTDGGEPAPAPPAPSPAGRPAPPRAPAASPPAPTKSPSPPAPPAPGAGPAPTP